MYVIEVYVRKWCMYAYNVMRMRNVMRWDNYVMKRQCTHDIFIYKDPKNHAVGSLMHVLIYMFTSKHFLIDNPKYPKFSVSFNPINRYF